MFNQSFAESSSFTTILSTSGCIFTTSSRKHLSRSIIPTSKYSRTSFQRTRNSRTTRVTIPVTTHGLLRSHMKRFFRKSILLRIPLKALPSQNFDLKRGLSLNCSTSPRLAIYSLTRRLEHFSAAAITHLQSPEQLSRASKPDRNIILFSLDLDFSSFQSSPRTTVMPKLC